jgi:hypothetical protein
LVPGVGGVITVTKSDHMVLRPCGTLELVCGRNLEEFEDVD